MVGPMLRDPPQRTGEEMLSTRGGSSTCADPGVVHPSMLLNAYVRIPEGVPCGKGMRSVSHHDSPGTEESEHPSNAGATVVPSIDADGSENVPRWNLPCQTTSAALSAVEYGPRVSNAAARSTSSGAENVNEWVDALASVAVTVRSPAGASAGTSKSMASQSWMAARAKLTFLHDAGVAAGVADQPGNEFTVAICRLGFTPSRTGTELAAIRIGIAPPLAQTTFRSSRVTAGAGSRAKASGIDVFLPEPLRWKV